MLKFLVKVFVSLYLLNMYMDQALIVIGLKFFTIMTHLSDLEVKVMDLEILCLNILV